MVGTGRRVGGSRGRLAARSWTLGAICGALLAAALPAGASAAGTPGASDRDATFTYLQARYDYLRALIAHSTALIADTRAVPPVVKRECGGVLAHEPQEVFAPSVGKGPRAAGEAARRSKQHIAVLEELTSTLTGAEHATLAPLEAAFEGTAERLRWSDPRVAAAIATERKFLSDGPAISPAEACADLRAWAQSGFQRLAPHVLEYEKRTEERFEAAGSEPSVEALLRPYEGRAERRLIERTEQLEHVALQRTSTRLSGSYYDLEEAVGLPVPKRVRHETTSTTLGRGRTRAGLKFVLSELPAGNRHGCSHEVSVDYELSRNEGSGNSILIGGSSSPGLCLSGRSADRAPHVDCEEGALVIAAVVAPAVRRVRLLLGDHGSVTSGVVSIPRRRGGPAGVYVQALGRRGPRPTELIELDGAGHTVATERVPRHRACPSLASEEPQSIVLVHGRTPAGETFKIEGVRFPAGFGPGSFNLNLEGGVERPQEAIGFSRGRKEAFALSVGDECAPKTWAVVYGLLRAPGASVSAVTATGEVPLTLVPIPARFGAGGELAYGVFARFPSRVIVRDAAGHVLASDDLEKKAVESREYCEGYAEH